MQLFQQRLLKFTNAVTLAAAAEVYKCSYFSSGCWSLQIQLLQERFLKFTNAVISAAAPEVYKCSYFSSGSWALQIQLLQERLLKFTNAVTSAAAPEVYKCSYFSSGSWCLYMQLLQVGPPLWSSGQSSWVHIQRSWFYSRRYQIFWEVVGLEPGPLSVVSTIEELLGRNSSGSGLESREYGRRNPSRWPRGSLYPQKLALTSPTNGGQLVGVVRSQTQATEFVFVFVTTTSAEVKETWAYTSTPHTSS
jgi:hypothetical protein